MIKTKTVNKNHIGTTILNEPIAVDNRLNELGLSRRVILAIAKKTIAASNNITDSHPPGAFGRRRYDEFLRYLTDDAQSGDWIRDDRDNLIGLSSKKHKIRLLFQNVYAACDLDIKPQAISPKKSASIRACSGNSATVKLPLEDYMELPKPISEGEIENVYYFMLDINGALELSCPTIAKNQFDQFIERIFIANSLNDYDLDITSAPDNYDEGSTVDTSGNSLRVTQKL